MWSNENIHRFHYFFFLKQFKSYFLIKGFFVVFFGRGCCLFVCFFLLIVFEIFQMFPTNSLMYFDWDFKNSFAISSFKFSLLIDGFNQDLLSLESLNCNQHLQTRETKCITSYSNYVFTQWKHRMTDFIFLTISASLWPKLKSDKNTFSPY